MQALWQLFFTAPVVAGKITIQQQHGRDDADSRAFSVPWGNRNAAHDETIGGATKALRVFRCGMALLDTMQQQVIACGITQ
jgi:hypothetical protein